MTARRSRRWFQLGLKSLFLLTLLVATFLAGYTAATKRAEQAVQAAQDGQRSAEEARKAEQHARRVAELTAERLLIQAENLRLRAVIGER